MAAAQLSLGRVEPSIRKCAAADQTMWRQRSLIALLLAACLLQSHAAEQDVLVLVEDARIRSTHSAFFGDLRQQGWKVTIKSAADKTLRLRDWDDWLYGKIAIFASSIPGQSQLLSQLADTHLRMSHAMHAMMIVYSPDRALPCQSCYLVPLSLLHMFRCVCEGWHAAAVADDSSQSDPAARKCALALVGMGM